MTQYYFTGCITVCWLAVHCRYWPHRFKEDNMLKAMCEFCVASCAMTALARRDDAPVLLAGSSSSSMFPSFLYGIFIALAPLFCAVAAIKALRIASKKRTLSPCLDRLLARVDGATRDAPQLQHTGAMQHGTRVRAYENYRRGVASSEDYRTLLDYFAETRAGVDTWLKNMHWFDAFVSYRPSAANAPGGADLELAQAVYRELGLAHDHVSVFLDTECLPLGVARLAYQLNALSHARVVIVIVSSHSVARLVALSEELECQQPGERRERRRHGGCVRLGGRLVS